MPLSKSVPLRVLLTSTLGLSLLRVTPVVTPLLLPLLLLPPRFTAPLLEREPLPVLLEGVVERLIVLLLLGVATERLVLLEVLRFT